MPKEKRSSGSPHNESKRVRTNYQMDTQPQTLGIRLIPEYLQQLADQNQLEAFSSVFTDSVQGGTEINCVLRNAGPLLCSLVNENKFDYVDAFIAGIEQQIQGLKLQQQQKYPPLKNLILAILAKVDREAGITFVLHYPGQIDISKSYKYNGIDCGDWLSHGYDLYISLLEKSGFDQLKAAFLRAVNENPSVYELGMILNYLSLESFLQSITLEEHSLCLKIFYYYQMVDEFQRTYNTLKEKYPHYKDILFRWDLFENTGYAKRYLVEKQGPDYLTKLAAMLETVMETDFVILCNDEAWVKIITTFIPYPEWHDFLHTFVQKIQDNLSLFRGEQWLIIEKNFDWEFYLSHPYQTRKTWWENTELLFTLHPAYEQMRQENKIQYLAVQSFLHALANQKFPTITSINLKDHIFSIFAEFYDNQWANGMVQQYFPFLLSLPSDPNGFFESYMSILADFSVARYIDYAFTLPLLKKALLISRPGGAIGYDLKLDDVIALSMHSNMQTDISIIAWDLIDYLIETVQSNVRTDLTSSIVLNKLLHLLKFAPKPPQNTIFSKIANYKTQHSNNPSIPYHLDEVERFFLENMDCRGPMRQALTLAARANLKKGAQLKGLHADEQSTHGKAVHKSCSETAKKLWENYFVNRFPDAKQRVEEVQKAINELLDFYYQKALAKVRPVYRPMVQKQYERVMNANWDVLSEQEQTGYLQIFTYLLPAKLGDAGQVLFPRRKNELYWLETDFRAHRFLFYCHFNFFQLEDPLTKLKFYQILASLWRAIEDPTALEADYQKEVKEKIFRNLLSEMAREYNTSDYHTVFLVDHLPPPEIITSNLIYANAIYLLSNYEVIFVSNTQAQKLPAPNELIKNIFEKGEKTTQWDNPKPQQDKLPAEIINSLWAYINTVGWSRYCSDSPTCFGGCVNGTMSLLDGQHPLVYTDQVTSSRILNFIVDFYSPKFEALSPLEKETLAQYAITEETLPKSFTDRYLTEFKQHMLPHVQRKALDQDEIDCWFVGEELPVSLFTVINKYCKEKQKATPPSPREQFSLFQSAPAEQENPGPTCGPT